MREIKHHKWRVVGTKRSNLSTISYAKDESIIIMYKCENCGQYKTSEPLELSLLKEPTEECPGDRESVCVQENVSESV